jgi:stress-induced-phosphoprotein 1
MILAGPYNKAGLTYAAGLAHDPENEDLNDGWRRATDAFDMRTVPVEVQESVARAEADPELMAIVAEPVICQLMSSTAAQLKNAGVATAKVLKLVDAGLILA